GPAAACGSSSSAPTRQRARTCGCVCCFKLSTPIVAKLKAGWGLGGSGLRACVVSFQREIRERLRCAPAVIAARQRGERVHPARHAATALAYHAARSGDIGLGGWALGLRGWVPGPGRRALTIGRPGRCAATAGLWLGGGYPRPPHTVK